MKRFMAGAMLFLFMLAMGPNTGAALAQPNETQAETVAVSDDSVNEDEEADDSDVLGAKRDQSDKFVLGVEIAVTLTFAIGLVAASHGAVVKGGDNDGGEDES